MCVHVTMAGHIQVLVHSSYWDIQELKTQKPKMIEDSFKNLHFLGELLK